MNFLNRNKDKSILFLSVSTLIGLFLLPFAIVKKPFKDWIIVYLVCFIGNSYSDKYLVAKGYLQYKIRPLPSLFNIHLPFDYVLYPLVLLYYNQWTLNSKPLGIILKLFPFVIPLILFETYAANRTKLITWKKGWTWYHSLISLIIKLLLCRSIIAIIRTINIKNISLN
ncbi:CBO0543 family protein [Cytobacillus praedii]|uniref:CBO0543 family protein n=1 Tax=Cytobacillus praedii TaxID=1742358 RepID=UPI003AF65BFF